jgi:hypothetical protein
MNTELVKLEFVIILLFVLYNIFLGVAIVKFYFV